VIDTTVVPPVVTATIPINGALSVAVSPDSRWIYVGTNYSVTKIDAQTNTVVKTVGVGAGVWDVVVSPDGQRVYAVLGMAGVDGLWAYNADDLSQLWEVNLYTDHPMSVGLSSDGATAYISATNYAGFAEINTATGTFIKRPFVGQANGVAIHPAGHTVYNVGGSTLKSMDTTTHVVTYTPIPTAGDLYGISVTPDGAELYISTHWGSEMHVVNAQTRTLLHTYALSGGAMPVSKFIGPAIAAAGLPANPHAVPALSPWAMGSLGAVLAAAVWRSQRRRRGRPRGAV
jgi:DNA-binding beta-propeller fold protein YncE